MFLRYYQTLVLNLRRPSRSFFPLLSCFMASMDPTLVLLVLASSTAHLLFVVAQPAIPISRITVVGVVFCDTCSTNTLSRHSYFLPGVEVNIKCKFKATSPKASEQMTVSVNRSTDKHGVYKLEIPHVDGVDCVEGLAVESMCQASLIRSPSSACSLPSLKTSTNQISVKSKYDNLCIYSLNALSYRPFMRNVNLCRKPKQKRDLPSPYDASKCFLPLFPPYGFPWPLHSLPLPPLPPLSSWPFPQFPNPQTLPFPFPPLPPFLSGPSLFNPPPPPAFNLGDPKTWFPNFPSFSPPPPAFNLGDLSTWGPHFPPSATTPKKEEP